MAHTWLVQAPATNHLLDLGSVSLLIDAGQAREPARAMLQVVNRNIPVEFICLVAYGGDGPRLVEGHAIHGDAAQIPQTCFERYRRHFYRFDEVTGIAARLGRDANETAPLVALHCAADDIPHRQWREQIYEREGLPDRLSLLYASAPGLVHAVNLYRNAAMGCFQPQEIDRVLAVSPLFRQVHRCALGADARARDRQSRIADAERCLARRTPLLSAREREVCARIAQGMTADGVAVDLGIAPSTVITLRKRAYMKLDIHNRLDLVRLVQ